MLIEKWPPKAIRTLLIENHKLVRESLGIILWRIPSIEMVGEADTGWDGVKMTRSLKPDLVILDFKLPDISGIEVTQRILKIVPSIKILILTGETHALAPHWCLAAGAHSFLRKSISLAEFKQALTSLFYPQETTSQNPPPPIENLPYADLTLREIEIMRMMIRGETVESMAKQLFLEPKTIYGHRSHIFKKLNVKNVVALALLAFRQGIITAEDLRHFASL